MPTLSQSITTVTTLKYEEVGKYVLIEPIGKVFGSDEVYTEFRLLPKRAFRKLMKQERGVDAVLNWTLKIPKLFKVSGPVMYLTDEELKDYKEKPGITPKPSTNRPSSEEILAKLRTGNIENFVSYRVGNDGFCYSIETKRPINRAIFVNPYWAAHFLAYNKTTDDALAKIPQVQDLAKDKESVYYKPDSRALLFTLPDDEFQEIVDQARVADPKYWSSRVDEIVFEKYTKHLWKEEPEDDDDDEEDDDDWRLY